MTACPTAARSCRGSPTSSLSAAARTPSATRSILPTIPNLDPSDGRVGTVLFPYRSRLGCTLSGLTTRRRFGVLWSALPEAVAEHVPRRRRVGIGQAGLADVG